MKLWLIGQRFWVETGGKIEPRRFFSDWKKVFCFPEEISQERRIQLALRWAWRLPFDAI